MEATCPEPASPGRERAAARSPRQDLRTSSLTRARLDAWVGGAPWWSTARRARRQLAEKIVAESTVDATGGLVAHDLDISFVHGLDRLPPHLVVRRTLRIEGVPIAEMATELRICNLFVVGCPYLRRWSGHLEASGDVVVEANARLVSWPQQLRIDGRLTIKSCPLLRALPDPGRLGGDVLLFHPHVLDTRRLRPSRGEERLSEGHCSRWSQEKEILARHALADPSRPIAATFGALPAHPVAPEDLAHRTCPLTLDALGEADDVVLWRRGGVLAGARFAEFVAWWGPRGTCPETRQKITCDELFRRAP